jgi:hypothetical protein
MGGGDCHIGIMSTGYREPHAGHRRCGVLGCGGRRWCDRIAIRPGKRLVIAAVTVPPRSEMAGANDELGVPPAGAERIDLFLHGAEDQPAYSGPRDVVISYCGHSSNAGTGLDVPCQALALVRDCRDGRTPSLEVHGCSRNGVQGDFAKIECGGQCAPNAGASESAHSLNRIDLPEMI